MESDSDLYDDIVSTYIGVIRQDSPASAAAIEQIHATCGSRTALRATLIITLLKAEVQQYQAIPDIGIYSYMFRDYPEALPLLELAVKCWLHDRRIRDAALGIRQNGNLTDAEAGSLSTTKPPPGLEA